MIYIIIICLIMSLVSLVAEFLGSLIVYKRRIKTYKEIVEKYDLDVQLPRTFKEWYNFNMKMFDYHKNCDIVDYLYYLDRNNINGKSLENNNE